MMKNLINGQKMGLKGQIQAHRGSAEKWIVVFYPTALFRIEIVVKNAQLRYGEQILTSYENSGPGKFNLLQQVGGQGVTNLNVFQTGILTIHDPLIGRQVPESTL